MTFQQALASWATAPTLEQGHTDDLIYESSSRRLWRSRMTVEDGEPYNDKLTVEVYEKAGKNGRACWYVERYINPRA